MNDKSQLGGIYKITNLANGKIYIGSSTYIKQRFGIHKYKLKNKNHDNKYLQRAWDKFGKECFTFEVVEHVYDFSILEIREQHWMDILRSYDRGIGYNLRIKANNNNGISYNIGRRHSEETKRKISLGNKGKKISDETRAKISAWQKGMIPVNATKAARLVNKKLDKWPCEKGYLCRCSICKITRNEYLRSWRASKKTNTRGAIAGRVG